MDNKSNNFWEATYRQNIAKMIGVCCRYTQNRQTAEDLAHDAFVVAIDKVSSFENKGPFEAWLRRIAVNVALQYLREQKKQEKLQQVTPYYVVYGDGQEENPVSENLAFSEAELLEIISYLPEHHRLVFNLYVVDNFTHAQIAAQLGISEGTSKSHLARARKKIRELLSERLGKNKERKRSFLFLIFPFKFWNIDNLVGGTLNGLSIQPQRKLSRSNTDFSEGYIPGYKPSDVSNKIYLKTGIWAFATAVILTGVSNWHFDSYSGNNDPVVLVGGANSMPDSVSDLNSTNNKVNQNIFSDSIAATISDNPIIVENTKNSEPMKNLSTLGGLLMASLAFDSSALMTEPPVLFKNQQLVTNRIVESAGTVGSIKSAVAQNSDLLSGTFYASKLLWSDANYKLYLIGDHVKVDLNTQKFTGSGRFSFLNKIKYLVIDGTPMKLNETIRLTDKKYHLEQLSASEGMKKYGDPGKDGVVEITLAE